MCSTLMRISRALNCLEACLERLECYWKRALIILSITACFKPPSAAESTGVFTTLFCGAFFDGVIITGDRAEVGTFVMNWKELSEVEKSKKKEEEYPKKADDKKNEEEDEDDDDAKDSTDSEER